MTSLPPPRPALLWQPRDYTVWDANRDRIYEYYLVEKKDLSETKRLMETRYGFPEHESSKNMWEHVLLRHFGFRKNLSKSDWAPIGQSIAKRRRLGKDTYAIDLCGAQVPRRRVEKNIPQEIALGANSPKLPRDILIRTPPPQEPFASRELQRRVNMSDLPHATQAVAFIANMLPERILEVRRNSPFIQTMLRLPVLLESYVVTDNDIRDSFASLSQMYQQRPSPRLFGTSTSLEILSFACFSVSSRAWIIEPRPLLDWIGKVVDLHFLHGIFSADTPMLIQLWWCLLNEAQERRSLEAFKCLIEVGLQVANGQWARFCLQSCFAAYQCMRNLVPDAPFVKYVREMVYTGISVKVLVIDDPLLFWISAANMADIAMMEILAHAGYGVSELPTLQQQAVLWSLFEGTGKSKVTCLRYLLKAGVATAPVLLNEVYWRGPGIAMLAIDRLWLGLNPKYTMLLNEVYKSSSRGDDTVTVSGICRAASDGLDSLDHYLVTTPCATVKTKTVLLEIALSEIAAKGRCGVLDCLLDYGIDPNVPSLSGNDFSGPDSSPKLWNPTLRAIKTCNLEAVKVLSFRNPSLDCHDCFVSVLSQIENYNCWVDTIELLKTLGLDPQRFGDDRVIQAALSECDYGNQQGVERVARIFELFNVRFDKKIDRMNFLQMAIRQHCSFSTVEVLLRHEADDCPELLFDALQSNSQDRERIVQLLLERGMEPSTGDASRILEATLARRQGNARRMEESLRLYCLMLKRGVRWPVKAPTCGTNLITLLLGVEADDCLIVDVLDAGYDLSLQGQHNPRTPLMEAISRGRMELALDFIRRGANVNAVNFPRDGDIALELTALHIACAMGAPLSFIRTLIDVGARVNTGSEFEAFTSLHCAVFAGSLNIASFLISRGAFANAAASSIQERTLSPLDFAAEMGDLEMCQLLYDLGGRSATRVVTDVDGAVQLARLDYRLGVLQFFEERVGGLDRIPDLKGKVQSLL
ncbi:hypothetical protein PG985_005378 [Apiospora marii]|uniref:Clr5 domain-containing protein n=1 Tax=Apiospora marii TaxID=335849 RepID=A0ABR1SBW0_9PEZI